MNSFRGGMQVHAVPDDERAVDARGQPLPWGYSYADSSLNRKQPVERGPFGRTTNRRSLSRTSRTATPGKEDPKRVQNEKVIDDVFAKFKKDLEEKESKTPREQKPLVTTGSLPHARSAMDLTQSMTSAPPAPGTSTFKEPTEVLIYGYGGEYQYAAIEFYETASAGRIYEDYDRYPPNPRYSTFLATTVPSIPRSLPQSAVRKINTYQGGDHWIKVTFDSPEAAERACYFSPHVIHGYACHAEPWRGVGPNADVPVAATSASSSGAETLRRRRQPPPAKPFSTMPSRIHSAPLLTGSQPSISSSGSSTASSATAAATDLDSETIALAPIPESSLSSPPTSPTSTNTLRQNEQQSQPSPQKPLRVRGATRAVLLPASAALLPVAPWSQRAFGHLPLLGPLFGGDPALRPGEGGGGIVGEAVPRKVDGGFDWERASWYWRVCWWVDGCVGTDLCGMKGED